MGAAAFWIALAAVIIAGYWRGKTKEEMRHETVRLLIEKGQAPDHEQLRELLNPKPSPLPPNHPWARPGPSGYTQLRVVGTILMIAGPGVAALIAGFGFTNEVPQLLTAAAGTGVFVILLGIAFFFASRFLAPPAKSDHESDKAA